jgi:hypothetical protein
LDFSTPHASRGWLPKKAVLLLPSVEKTVDCFYDLIEDFLEFPLANPLTILVEMATLCLSITSGLPATPARQDARGQLNPRVRQAFHSWA